MLGGNWMEMQAILILGGKLVPVGIGWNWIGNLAIVLNL